MAFFVVTPEDAGHAEDPGGASLPLVVFDTWLGDDLVRAHPVFLVSARLKDTLDVLPEPTGFRSLRIRTKPSRFMRGLRPELRLPTFWALEISGQAGVHPLGLAQDGSLVVSQAGLDCLVRHSIPHAQLSQFVPAVGAPDGAWPAGTEDGAAERAGTSRP
ncbi:MAG TPA: hypothetical protein VI589_11315 [Vicinamibacteria bacterium]